MLQSEDIVSLQHNCKLTWEIKHCSIQHNCKRTWEIKHSHTTVNVHEFKHCFIISLWYCAYHVCRELLCGNRKAFLWKKNVSETELINITLHIPFLVLHFRQRINGSYFCLRRVYIILNIRVLNMDVLFKKYSAIVISNTKCTSLTNLQQMLLTYF